MTESSAELTGQAAETTLVNAENKTKEAEAGVEAEQITGGKAEVMTGGDKEVDAKVTTEGKAEMTREGEVTTGEVAGVTTGRDAEVMTEGEAVVIPGGDAEVVTGGNAEVTTWEKAEMMTWREAEVTKGEKAEVMTGGTLVTTEEVEVERIPEETTGVKLLRYAKEVIFFNRKRESNLLYTACEGIKTTLYNLYSIKERLTDEIIDSYMLSILRSSENFSTTTTYVPSHSNLEYINCAVMSMLLSKKQQSAVTDFDIVSQEALGLYNLGRRHWVLVVFKFQLLELLLVDPQGELGSTLNNILSSWKNYLKLKRGTNQSKWKVSTLPHPKQQDGISCGVDCLMKDICLDTASRSSQLLNLSCSTDFKSWRKY